MSTRLKPIISLGQLTQELINERKAILMVGHANGKIQALCQGVAVYGMNTKDALQNLELALIDAEGGAIK